MYIPLETIILVSTILTCIGLLCACVAMFPTLHFNFKHSKAEEKDKEKYNKLRNLFLSIQMLGFLLVGIAFIINTLLDVFSV